MTDILSPSPWSDRQEETRQHPAMTYAAALARIAELEAALEPFADVAESYIDDAPNNLGVKEYLGRFRAARAALRNR